MRHGDRVPVMATTENGPIRVGDYLQVSLSTPGAVMRCGVKVRRDISRVGNRHPQPSDTLSPEVEPPSSSWLESLGEFWRTVLGVAVDGVRDGVPSEPDDCGGTLIGEALDALEQGDGVIRMRLMS